MGFESTSVMKWKRVKELRVDMIGWLWLTMGFKLGEEGSETIMGLRDSRSGKINESRIPWEWRIVGFGVLKGVRKIGGYWNWNNGGFAGIVNSNALQA